MVGYMDSELHLAVLRPPLARTAYIYHRGGLLRFGKLTMRDADLKIIGRPARPFDFFQKHSRQLVAGYSKSTASNGLLATI